MPSGAYFPDGRVASREVLFSPVSQEWAPNAQPFQAAPDPIRQSDEQGIGRSPGQQWPRQYHVEQFNFAALAGMSGPGEYPRDPATGTTWYDLTNRPSRDGWSVPLYYEQSRGHRLWPAPVTVSQPSTQAYTTLVDLMDRYQ